MAGFRSGDDPCRSIRDPRSSIRCSNQGTAATELALVFPLLMLLVLGCVDLGRVAFGYIALSNAARAGAEFGASHRFTNYTEPFWREQIRQTVREEMSRLQDFNESDLAVSISTTYEPGRSTGGYLSGVALPRVRVEATYPFESIVDWPGLPNSIQLRRPVTMREYR